MHDMISFKSNHSNYDVQLLLCYCYLLFVLEDTGCGSWYTASDGNYYWCDVAQFTTASQVKSYCEALSPVSIQILSKLNQLSNLGV